MLRSSVLSIFIVGIFLIQHGCSQTCGITNFPPECECTDGTDDEKIVKCLIKEETEVWTVKTSLDQIYDVFWAESPPITTTLVEFHIQDIAKFYTNANPTTIPVGTTEKMKFRSLTINWDDKIASIADDAFQNTIDVLTSFTFKGCTASCPTNLFREIHKLINLKTITMDGNTAINILGPSQFNGANAALETVTITNGGVTTIAANTFSALKSVTTLKKIDLSNNALAIATIDANAFNDWRDNTELDISNNPTLKTLPQATFSKILEKTGTKITVGKTPNDEANSYTCNKDLQWICGIGGSTDYTSRVLNLECSGAFYGTLSQYCTKIKAGDCPDLSTLAPECTCAGTSPDFTITCLTAAPTPAKWEVTKSLDSVATALMDQGYAEPVKQLVLQIDGHVNGQEINIGADVSGMLKFKDLKITWDSQIKTLAATAFDSTKDTVEIFTFNGCTTSGSCFDQTLFLITHKFTKLKTLTMEGNTGITALKQADFNAANTALQTITIKTGGITTIGENTFSAYSAQTALTKIDLSGNKLDVTKIHENAFAGWTDNRVLDISSNPTLKTLPENIFSKILEKTGTEILAGPTTNTYTCDANIQWLCKNNYRTRVKNLMCSESFQGSIDQYCVTLETKCPDLSTLAPECSCAGTSPDFSITCLTSAPNPVQWDVKRSLDNVSLALKNGNFGTLVKDLTIQIDGKISGQEISIPADVSANLQFKTLKITWDNQFKTLENGAFTSSPDSVTSFTFEKCTSNCPETVFNTIKAFTKLTSLTISNNEGFTSIPANGFNGLTSPLTDITFTNSKLASIGANAFSGSTNIKSIDLKNNVLSAAGLNDTAFSGLPNGVVINLQNNPTLDTFPERVFKQFLEQHETNIIQLGPTSNDPNDEHSFNCNADVLWLCGYDNLNTRVPGFNCIGNQFTDISNYCTRVLCPSNFGTDVPECECSGVRPDFNIKCVTKKPTSEPWKVKEKLDTIANLLTQNEANPGMITIAKLTLSDQYLTRTTSIPTGSTDKLKFKEFEMHYNGYFNKIDTNAFDGTKNVLTSFTASNCKGNCPINEVFDIVGTLTNLKELSIPGSARTIVHTDQFNGLAVETVSFPDGVIETVQSHAFRGAPNLVTIDLKNNMLSTSEIDPAAFLHVPKLHLVDLRENDGINNFTESVFKPILDLKPNVTLLVGENGGNDPKYRINCGSETEWVCVYHLYGRLNFTCSTTGNIQGFCNNLLNPSTTAPPPTTTTADNDAVKTMGSSVLFLISFFSILISMNKFV